MLQAKIKGNIGNVNYAKITEDAMWGVVSEVASGCHERTATEINNQTYETFRGVEIRKGFSGKEAKWAKPGDVATEVVSTAPWSQRLEFHGYPFMRPAAWYMKRKISRIIKMILGPMFKGKTGLKQLANVKKYGFKQGGHEFARVVRGHHEKDIIGKFQ